MADSVLTKSARARALGISRSTLYYVKKQPGKDWLAKCAIEDVLRGNPGYGHRRIAKALGRKDERPALRVMKLFGIKPYRRRGRKWRKPKEKQAVYPNLLMATVPAYRNHIWVADFTHIAWRRGVILATTLDVYTRDVVGLSVATRGGTVLVTQALWSGLLNHPRPVIFHSDNGVEYNAILFRETLESLGIQISRSKKGCPWENGYQESFYDKFKVDLGDPNRFATLGELVAEIYRTVHYYNTERIHSAFGMPPRTFAQLHATATLHAIV
ncbi:MAG TPA: IS3 family transposase [Candidatus Paceibacterota bacterium]|nr:IS3 family transposase [Candidatus Paceibacterota bacterium]